MTVILTSFSLAWICSICIPWGRGSNGLLSITTSFLCQNSRTSSSGEQCIISSPSPINLSSSCFTKVGHEPFNFNDLPPRSPLSPFDCHALRPSATLHLPDRANRWRKSYRVHQPILVQDPSLECSGM